MMQYLDNLIQACEKAKIAKPSLDFVITNFDEIPDIQKGIYIIREISGDPKDTFEVFKNFKASIPFPFSSYCSS